MARCSFDIHVQEILGTLVIGATIVMLHPGGLLDFDYLASVLYNKKVTYMHTVPSFLQSFIAFVGEHRKQRVLGYLRSLCSSGM